jgi:hypothetical protein
MSYWCEFCRDHYDDRHFDEGGRHRVGHQFGPYGSLLAAEVVVRALADADPVAHEGDPAYGEYVCQLCNEVMGGELHYHEATCPWRLAKEWIANQA